MQVEDEADAASEEFMSTVSCLSSPTSVGGQSNARQCPRSEANSCYVDCSSPGSDQRPSFAAHVARTSSSAIDLDDEENAERGDDDDERRRLLGRSDDDRSSSPPPPPSQLIRARLSSPPDLVVEDHGRHAQGCSGGGGGGGGSAARAAFPGSSSLHLNIPSAVSSRRPSASSCSSNQQSYKSCRSALETASLANGSLKQEVENRRRNCTQRVDSRRTTQPLDAWQSRFAQPPRVTHPLQENVLLSLLISCLNYACGFCIGVPLAAVLLALNCLVIPLRLLFYLITRWTVRGLWRWLWRSEHCDPLWPLGGVRRLGPDEGGDTALVMATMQGSNLDISRIRQLLWQRLINVKDSAGYLTNAKLSSRLSASDDCGLGCSSSWSHDSRFEMQTHVNAVECGGENGVHLETLRDLEAYLNRLLYDPACFLNSRRPLWDVRALTNFGVSEAVETRCTLLIVRLHSALTDGCLCPAKLLTLMNDSQLSFDCEPRMRGDDWPPFNVFIRASFHVWHAFTIVGAGPLTLLRAAACRCPNPVWSLVGSAASRRRPDEEMGGSKGFTDGLRVTWARVPQADQLMKLERILRCTIQELLLAFVAGALRRHFRSRGVKHPPDLWTSVPVTFRDYMPISGNLPCRFVLTPVHLPLSVDGIIPRIWETQRRLCESLDSAYPRTARFLAETAGGSLPKSWLRTLLGCTHRASDGFVCFWRVSGELSFSDRQIHSLLVYPSLRRLGLAGGCCKYGFTFVQTGNEIVLSLAVNQTVFGSDAETFLRQFQYELHGLLAHMSTRMLTLSQATFLPSPLLWPSRLARSPLKIVQQVNSAVEHRQEDNLDDEHPDEEPSTTSADSETLEELEQLMATVQNELQTMKANPRGNRGDYIAKLAELESKMEAFHQNIVEKLERRRYFLPGDCQQPSEQSWSTRQHKTSTSSSTSEDERKALLDPNFEALLQPLRADAETLLSETSREGAMKLRRKRSKRLDSPSRISSRKNSEVVSNSPSQQLLHGTP